MAENSKECLELANGCLRCSIKDTGIVAIEKLMDWKEALITSYWRPRVLLTPVSLESQLS